MADAARAERAVLRACCSGLDVGELQRQVLAALRGVMTIDAAFFATADPETLLFTGAHSEEPLVRLAPVFLDNELGARDVNTFTELVRAPGHVRSLDTATRSEWMTSPRYRDIMRPVGLGDELRARSWQAVTAGATCACTAKTARSASPRPRPTSSVASRRTSRMPCARRSSCTDRRSTDRTDQAWCCSTSRWS